MAIAAQIVVESRRYSGWADPRYPIGHWQAALAATGDLSGGELAIDLVFQGALTAALNSQMYSVERFAIRIGDETDRTVRIAGINMGGPTNRAFFQSYSILLVGETGSTRSQIRGDQFSMLPWFLGAQRQAGTTASLSCVVPNVNTVVVTFEAEGYRWNPRSVLIDGGPQRPPTGLYKA